MCYLEERVGMANLNFRVDDDLREELEAEAEAHGYGTLSAYVRYILQNRHETASGDEKFEERIAQLEERVDQLERTQTNTTQINTRQFRETDEHEPEPEPEPPRDLEPATPSSDPKPQGNDVEDPIDEALDGWEHGRGDEEIQERRESAEMTFEWLRKQDEPKRKRHFINALYEDVETGQNEETWWGETIKGALDHAAERGFIEKSKAGREYEWIG